MLTIKNISFRYDIELSFLFKDLSFETRAGDIVSISGKSGSGKTTLLSIICGVIPKIIHGELNGKILIKDQDISKLSLPQTAPHISLLMQEPDQQLFFPTVEQELAFAPENLKVPKKIIEENISSVLLDLDIESLRFEETAFLSFGQKKLVTFASILTLSPDIYLLDEPSAGLSKKYIEKISIIIKKLSESGKIIFIADHNKDLLSLANKMIVLDKIN